MVSNEDFYDVITDSIASLVEQLKALVDQQKRIADVLEQIRKEGIVAWKSV